MKLTLKPTGLTLAALGIIAPAARADQFEPIPPTSGVSTGPQYSWLLGNAFTR